MKTQLTKTLNLFEENGWTIKQRENPKSEQYWWVWEFITIQKNNTSIVLSTLVDPQEKKTQENIWALSVTTKEPVDRQEAENGVILRLGRHWKNNINEFISTLKNKNWL